MDYSSAKIACEQKNQIQARKGKKTHHCALAYSFCMQELTLSDGAICIFFVPKASKTCASRPTSLRVLCDSSIA